MNVHSLIYYICFLGTTDKMCVCARARVCVTWKRFGAKLAQTIVLLSFLYSVLEIYFHFCLLPLAPSVSLLFNVLFSVR